MPPIQATPPQQPRPHWKWKFVSYSQTYPILQVDGEPCRLKPSVIVIKLRNRSHMLMKQKRYNNTPASNYRSVNQSRRAVLLSTIYSWSLLRWLHFRLAQYRFKLEYLGEYCLLLVDQSGWQHTLMYTAGLNIVAYLYSYLLFIFS